MIRLINLDTFFPLFRSLFGFRYKLLTIRDGVVDVGSASQLYAVKQFDRVAAEIGKVVDLRIECYYIRSHRADTCKYASHD